MFPHRGRFSNGKRSLGSVRKGVKLSKSTISLLKNSFVQYTPNRVWGYLLKDMLNLKQRRSLVFFFSVLARSHSRKFTEETLTSLEEDMRIALSLLERDCPIYNITMHIFNHYINKIRDNGPLYAFWMFAQERLNSWITRRVLNRAKMEECVMETVQVS